MAFLSSAMASVMAVIDEIEKEKGLASGGVALKPTLALIGEAGPEAVAPIDYLKTLLMGEVGMRAARAGGGGNTTVIETHVDMRGATLMTENVPSQIIREVDKGIARRARVGRSRMDTTV